jgi:hypothetical protein
MEVRPEDGEPEPVMGPTPKMIRFFSSCALVPGGTS